MWFLGRSRSNHQYVRKLERRLEQLDSTLRRFAKRMQLRPVRRDVPDDQSFIAHLEMGEAVNILVEAIERRRFVRRLGSQSRATATCDHE